MAHPVKPVMGEDATVERTVIEERRDSEEYDVNKTKQEVNTKREMNMKQEAKNTKQETNSTKQEAINTKQDGNYTKQETNKNKHELNNTKQEANNTNQESNKTKQESNKTKQEPNNTKYEANKIKQEANNIKQEGDITGQSIGPLQAPPTTYKQRREEFRKIFKELAESERLIVDYACALQKDIILQGRLYLTESCLCFYSNIFWGTKITVKLKDIAAMTREKTARWIPNAIQICTNTQVMFFTSFSSRERSFQNIFRLWQNFLMEKHLTRHEFLQMVKQHYGSDLGLSLEEMECLQGSTDTAVQTQTSLNMKGEDHSGRLERPSSLRLPHTEQTPQDTSTPQGEDTHSPVVQQSTPIGEDTRSMSSCQRSPATPLNGFSPERTSKCSSLSLDLNANEDRASESSLSGSMEDVERECSTRGSQGRLFLNRVFRISAEKMFELLFTDSYFFCRFMDARKITGCTSTSWQRDASGSMKRSKNYTITINNPLVGKFSTATENQTLYKESRERHYYIVDAEVYTHDVPYHDYFYTLNRYCIIRTSKHKCRLRIHTDVKYNKQPWGFVKSFITKNSWSGIEDYFRHLEAELLEEEVELTQGSGDGGKASLRRRRRTFSRTLQDHARPIRQYSVDPELHRDNTMGAVDVKSAQKWNITSIITGMSLILLVLTVLNLGLLFKLWAMEDVAHRMYLNTKQRIQERAEASMAPDLGPRQSMLQSQDEARLLRAVLQDSINLLEQLRSSLLELQRSFQGRNKTSSPM
ncbi:protein Aster-C isoform X2 [Brachyhypopomus gauderio]|uniref:protein Aster-C isoform X2 n=1 Tax=Brachyhypopomus gauderio TaxID=698409 RepID=UPI0040427565